MKFIYTLMTAGAALAALTAEAAPVSSAAREAQAEANAYKGAVLNCDMSWAVDAMYPPLKWTLADRLASRDPRQEAANARRIMGTGAARESDEQARRRMERNIRALKEQYLRIGQQMKQAGFKVERYAVGTPMAEYVLPHSSTAIRSVRADSRRSGGKLTSAEHLNWEGGRSRLVVLPTVMWYSTPTESGRRLRVERRDFIYAVRDEVIESTNNRNYRGTQLNKWYFIDGNTDVNTLRSYFPTLPLNIARPDTGERPLQ
ncbi:MAG: hypothetical protein IKZ07_01620 [Akkermansia sp.]|nr:hypothetical protein [Akkermansia sp.]